MQKDKPKNPENKPKSAKKITHKFRKQTAKCHQKSQNADNHNKITTKLNQKYQTNWTFNFSPLSLVPVFPIFQ